MWNLISDLNTLKENSVELFLSRIWSLQKITPKRILNRGIEKPKLKFHLQTTGPRSINGYLWTVLEVRQNAGFNLHVPWTDISSRSWGGGGRSSNNLNSFTPQKLKWALAEWAARLFYRLHPLIFFNQNWVLTSVSLRNQLQLPVITRDLRLRCF